MRIAIIGTGNVGTALGTAWAARGHTLCYGSRAPSATPAAGAIPEASVREAVREAETVVLAVPWGALQAVIAEAGPLAGKAVIDCTNPLKPNLAGLEVGLTTSAAEQVAAWAPGASVFKAFNQTGAENMASPAGYAARPVMFVCGDDAARKPGILALAADLGFEAVDAGGLTAARLLEPLAMLWIHLAYRQQLGRNIAFALVRR
jgi:8-hydroxy-5-deazaflavin:NADPH oxidoreductase